MIESIAQTPEARGPAAWLVPVVKVLCAVIAVLLIGFCLGLFRMGSELALDYPFRRAGENAEFPPVGTLPFYLGCVQALLGMLFVWICTLVAAIALAFTFRAFTLVPWRVRFLNAVALLLMPMTLSAVFDIRRQVQWYEAHPLRPSQIHHPEQQAPSARR